MKPRRAPDSPESFRDRWSLVRALGARSLSRWRSISGSPGGPTEKEDLHESVGLFYLIFFDMCYCYILYSNQIEKFYTGACHEDLEKRIENHNTHGYGKHRFTATTKDWNLFLKIEVRDFSHAVRLERKIKSMKSSKYIRNLGKYPELIQKIVDETTKSS